MQVSIFSIKQWDIFKLTDISGYLDVVPHSLLSVLFWHDF